MQIIVREHTIANDKHIPCTMMILEQKPRWLKVIKICVAWPWQRTRKRSRWQH